MPYIIDRTRFQQKTPLFLQNKILIFLMIMTSTMLDLFNVTSILVSVRYLHEHYNVSPAIASWSLSAYAVTFAGFIGFAGRIGDIIGHDTQFIIGSIVFAIISLICAVVNNIYVFIVFRAFQGMAAATLIPSSYALMAHMFEGKQLNMAITVLSGMLSSANAGGLIVGGAFLESSVKYKGITYVSFAISLLLGIMAFFNFPIVSRNKDKLRDLDYIGSSILISGLLLIIVGFTEAGEHWNSPKTYVILPIGCVLVGVFIIYENYVSPKMFPNTHLLIPKPVWTIPNFIPLVFNSILNFSGYFGMIFISTSYFLYIDDVSPLITGVRYLPFIVTLLFTLILMSQIYGVFSPKWISTLGFLIGVGGLILFSRVDYKVSYYYWKFSFTGQVLLGFGSVLYFIHYLNMIITATPLKFQGIVTGIAQTFAQFGIALSFAVITSIVGDTSDKEKLHKRYINATYFCLACYGLGTLVLLFFVHDVAPTSPAKDDTTDDTDQNTGEKV